MGTMTCCSVGIFSRAKLIGCVTSTGVTGTSVTDIAYDREHERKCRRVRQSHKGWSRLVTGRAGDPSVTCARSRKAEHVAGFARTNSCKAIYVYQLKCEMERESQRNNLSSLQYGHQQTARSRLSKPKLSKVMYTFQLRVDRE